MSRLKFEKVSTLPGTLTANTIYFVVDPETGYLQIHVSNGAGNATRHIPTRAEIIDWIQSNSGTYLKAVNDFEGDLVVNDDAVWAGTMDSMPVLAFTNETADTGDRIGYFELGDDGIFRFKIANDDNSASATAFSLERTGNTPVKWTFNSTTAEFTGDLTAGSFNGDGSGLTDLNADEITTGTVPAARLGSGTKDNTTVLYGDNVFRVPSVNALFGTGSFQSAWNVAQTAVWAGTRTGGSAVAHSHSGAPANNKLLYWQQNSDGKYHLYLADDTNSAQSAIFTVERSGNTATKIALTATTIELNGAVAYTDLTASGSITANTLAGNGSAITALNGSNVTTGTIAPARLGSGTADDTTVLHGDGEWKVPSIVSDVINATASWVADVSANKVRAGANANGGVVSLSSSTAAANHRLWYWMNDNSGSLFLKAANDDNSLNANAIKIDRTNNVIDLVTISAPVAATSFAGNGSNLTNLNGGAVTTGIVPAARLGSGTANSTTVLYGDNVFRVPSANVLYGTGSFASSWNVGQSAVWAGTKSGGSAVAHSNANASAGNRLLFWQQSNDGSYNLYLSNDDASAGAVVISVERSGNTATEITFTANTINLDGVVSYTDLTASGTIEAAFFEGNGVGLTNLSASNVTTGTINPARLGSGTKDDTTVLYGDGVFRVPSVTVNNLIATAGWAAKVDENNVRAGANSNGGVLSLSSSTASAGNRLWHWSVNNAGEMNLRLANDDNSAGVNVVKFTRAANVLSQLEVTVTTLDVTATTVNLEATTINLDGKSNVHVQQSTQEITAMGASNIDCSLGNFFTKTVAANMTFTVSNVPASKMYSFILELTDGGNYTISWFNTVHWAAGAAPTLTEDGVDILGFYTRDNGTTWHGFVLSQDSKAAV